MISSLDGRTEESVDSDTISTMRSTLSPAALPNRLAQFSVNPSTAIVANGNIAFRAAITAFAIDALYSHVLPIPIFVVVVDFAFVTVGKADGDIVTEGQDGFDFGFSVGAAVGSGVGMFAGFLVRITGLLLGSALGLSEVVGTMLTDGMNEGAAVGFAEGLGVGRGVGLCDTEG